MAILNTYKKIQDELGIIGDSEAIREVVELVMSIAPTNISVLITGESGTGKEVFAQAIHQLSPRKNENLVSVNCGAIPEGLLESELFGHEKGAFTGAVAQKKGYFELADGGTILLDEIGEMSLQTQVKLLRVLETGEYMRVGGGKAQKANVRVIAATNRDLSQMVKQKHFRKDLYYRLKAVQLHLPPIRDRREDIMLLLEHFAAQALSNDPSLEFAGFSEDALRIIREYSWQGNVRELRNFVDTIIVLARGQQVTAAMAREHLTYYEEPVEVSTYLPIPMEKSVQEAERELIYKALVSLGIEVKEMKTAIMQLSDRVDNRNADGMMYARVEEVNGTEEIKALDELEREMIIKAMDRFRGNRRKVARALNISERTLYRKIKEYELVD